jgi:hypothetical protein
MYKGLGPHVNNQSDPLDVKSKGEKTWVGRSILGERYIYQFLCSFIYSIDIDIEIETDISKVKNFFDIHVCRTCVY